MKSKVLSVLLFFTLVFSSSTVFATEGPSEINSLDNYLPTSVSEKHLLTRDNQLLTEEEYNSLINEVGLTDEKIARYPISILRNLLAQDARILSNGEIKSFDVLHESNAPFTSPDLITPFGTISEDDLTMYGEVYSVTSDRDGFKKIYMAFEFEWNIDPFWALTDTLAIGIPESESLHLPTSGGKVVQHKTQYCHQLYYDSKPVCTQKTTPTKGYANSGVATNISLNYNAEYHRGWMEQYGYIESNKTGTTNVLFTYAHKLISGSPTITVSPIGVGITPTSTTDTQEYMVEFSY